MLFTIIGADQRHYGPVTADEVHEWIRDGRADGRTLARAEGTEEWKPLSAYAEFKEFTAASGVPPKLPTAAVPPANYDVLVAQPDFNVADCLTGSWTLLKNNFGLLLTACFVAWFLAFAISLIPMVGPSMTGVVYGGLYLVYLRRIRGEPARVGEALAGFGAPFIQLLLTGFLIAIVTTLGMCALLLPGIYLKVAWCFAIPLVIDKRLEFWSAMELSRKVATRVWLKLFLLTIVVFAPFIVAEAYKYYKVNTLTYQQLSPLMNGDVLGNFNKLLSKMVEISKDKTTATAIENLELISQAVLLINLPFATGALMYAYEALFLLGPRKPLSRQMAWGCFTTNLAMPGFGSLVGGRIVGYFQIPFTVVGFALTTVFGVKTIVWYLSNFARLQRQQDDPFANLLEIWTQMRWPLIGIAIFVFVLLWALHTSMSIMAEARKAELLAPRPRPPKLSEVRPLPPKLDASRPLPPKLHRED